MLTELKREAYEANMELPAHGLVHLNFGNASALDSGRAVMAIKPSGVPYDRLRAADMVLVDLEGKRVEGRLRPSSDAPTHVVLYRGFARARGIVHTHSPWATVWAQAEREIPLLGTTHADLSARPIPLTRPLTESEVEEDYEGATGRALVEAISEHDSCALVRGHGPFAWGASPAAAVEAAVTLEQVARLALLTTLLAPDGPPLADAIRRKHFERKHGPHAYYGQ